MQKLKTRRDKVLEAEAEQIRRDNGFEQDPALGQWLNSVMALKADPKPGSNSEKVEGAPETASSSRSEARTGGARGHQQPGAGGAGARGSKGDPKQGLKTETEAQLKSILEQAKAFAESKGLGESSSSRVPDAQPVDHLQGRRWPLQAEEPLYARRVAESSLVLPVEHIVVHRELKRIYTFCQSGRVATLRHLFGMLQDLEHETAAQAQQEPSVKQELKTCILQQILVWATFADQLAALHKEDRGLLSEVHQLLVSKLSSESSEDFWSEEDRDLCWRILFVGWDRFCRTTQ